MKATYRRFIEWLFHTNFDASKTADSNIGSFRVYTRLPAEWPEHVSHDYKITIENIPDWKEKVDVHIISEPTAAINGPLKQLLVEQRRGLRVYLEDAEHRGYQTLQMQLDFITRGKRFQLCYLKENDYGALKPSPVERSGTILPAPSHCSGMETLACIPPKAIHCFTQIQAK